MPAFVPAFRENARNNAVMAGLKARSTDGLPAIAANNGIATT